MNELQNNTQHKSSIEDQAAFWVVRLSSSDCTPEDRFAFEAWKEEDPAHEAMYFRLQKGNAVVDRHMTESRIQAMLETAREAGAPTPSRWDSVRQRMNEFPGGYAAVAASFTAIASALVLAILLIAGQPISNTTSQTQTASTNIETFETSIGERSTITLADNSIVSINTNSRLEVAFTPTTRLVQLFRGQAYFEVEEDADRPFIVEAGDKRVVALGTAFDVRFDTEDVVQVTLVEGRVKVDDRLTNATLPTRAEMQQPTKSIELNPGERLVAKLDLKPEVTKTDTIEETSWRKGQLVFRKRPLASVVDEMNRYSTQRLVVGDDPRVQSLEVSGVFNSGGRASSFVNALEALYPLEAERTNETELTLVWRDPN